MFKTNKNIVECLKQTINIVECLKQTKIAYNFGRNSERKRHIIVIIEH